MRRQAKALQARSQPYCGLRNHTILPFAAAATTWHLQSRVLAVGDEHQHRMVHLDAAELIGERQYVEAENRRHYPLGYRAGHMVLPAAVARVPLARILALEQDVRNDASDRHHHEEDGAQNGQAKPRVRHVDVRTSQRMDGERQERLQPEVDGAQAEAAEGTDEVHQAHVRLLEVADYAAAEARAEAHPQGAPADTADALLQRRIGVGQLLDLAVAHIDDDAHYKNVTKMENLI